MSPVVEFEFLGAVRQRLENFGVVDAGHAGAAEPEGSTDLPAIVLSLDGVERANHGLGDRVQVMQGALRVTSRIDLENPVLATDLQVILVDPIARVVQLPHGGLVRADGSFGALGSDDLEVSVAENGKTVVSGAPGPNQVRADPLPGQLHFGSALPDVGIIEASYYVGRWERRAAMLRGVLRVEVCDGQASDVQNLSEHALEVLGALRESGTLPGLHALSVWKLGTIARTPPDAEFRRRTLELRFEYEATIDRPDASGGLIRQVRVKPPDTPPLDHPPPESTEYESFEIGEA